MSFSLILLLYVCSLVNTKATVNSNIWIKEGTYNIAGLFRLHVTYANGCKDLYPYTIQMLEAFYYATNSINEMHIFLDNQTLGFIALDNCNHHDIWNAF